MTLDWAVQNQQLDVLNFLLRNYDVDVLKKNDAGRSSLTDAFDCGNTEVLAACLSHPSSSEENLLKIDQNILDASNNETVVHEFDFSTSMSSPSKTLLVRELPITRADNPFGSTDTPEDDTTGTHTHILHYIYILTLRHTVHHSIRAFQCFLLEFIHPHICMDI